MQPAASQIAQLYYRLQAGLLTDHEQQEWNAFMDAYPAEAEYLLQLDSEDGLAAQFSERSPSTVELIRERMLADIHRHISMQHTSDFPIVTPGAPAHRVHFLKTAWFRYAAAIIILFGLGAYFWTATQKQASETVQTDPVKQDILPGGQKAMLTLDDGRTIILDNAKNGQLALQNGSKVIKKDGQVMYNAGGATNNEVTYNTMSTPRGGQYQLTLSDGTRVWLNAASNITYPTIFTGKTREVKIAGEVYFEVAKNKNRPFIVQTRRDKITVLGTSFNVNAYEDESDVKISLIEGLINVNDKKVKPGQAYSNGNIIKTNITQDLAWKDGLFSLENKTVEQVMRELARWYDVEVVYDKGRITAKLSGEMDKNLTLKEALDGLNGVEARFILQGKTVHVLPLK